MGKRERVVTSGPPSLISLLEDVEDLEGYGFKAFSNKALRT